MSDDEEDVPLTKLKKDVSKPVRAPKKGEKPKKKKRLTDEENKRKSKIENRKKIKKVEKPKKAHKKDLSSSSKSSSESSSSSSESSSSSSSSEESSSSSESEEESKEEESKESADEEDGAEEDQPLGLGQDEDVKEIWQFGNVLCFFASFDFSKLLENVSFCPRQLLDSLTPKEKPGRYLIDLMIALLELYSSKVTPKNWEKHFHELLLSEEFDSNDWRLSKPFEEFTPGQRLRALYDLCHILLSIHEPLREQVAGKEPDQVTKEPFGSDNKGARYWLFQRAGTLSFLKEVEPTFEIKRGKRGRTLKRGSWEILATNAGELGFFASSIATEALDSKPTENGSSSKKEKDKAKEKNPLLELYNKLVHDALPACELQETLAIRRKRRAQREGLDLSLILDDTSTRASRSKRVCYEEREKEEEFDD